MNRTEMIAIGLGLVAGYFLIQYLRKGEAAKARAAAAPDPTVPDWARGDRTLTDLWNGNWPTVTGNDGSMWTTN